jgi:hypothetical protein
MGSRIRKSRRGRSRSRKSQKTRKLRLRRSPYKLRRRSRSPRFFNFRRLSPQFAPTTQDPPPPPPKAQVLAPPKAQAPPTQTPQPQVQVLLQVIQPIKNVSASEIVIQRAATQKIAQSALASQLEAYKEAERQRLLSLQSIAEQQANDLKSKKGQGEEEGQREVEKEGEGEEEGEEVEEERPLVPAINGAGPQCGSLVCRKREKCIEGICTKTRLNVNFPNDDALEEIRIIAT